MKNLFANLMDKKPTRTDVEAGMKSDKENYNAMFNNLARYKGQQQKLSQGVMALEKLLLTTAGAAEEAADEVLWLARIASFQFLRTFLNEAAKQSNYFQGVDPANANKAMAEFTNAGLDLLIKEPEVALVWLASTSETTLLDDVDTSDLNYSTV